MDAKASFALTLESAALAGIVALSDEGRLFGSLYGWGARALLWTGSVLILAGAVLAILVVTPRLRSRSALEHEAPQSFIYFGHLQFWKPEDLETALQRQDMLPMLSRQLINTSKIAWRKHRFVQVSFLLAAIGGAFVFFAGLVA
ncbi:Pycsar system effector family protein [Streptomyces sp. NPDC005811]|uniref:Pycsar system effector family protein n=1 Tax=Streptomyces sp. NPDC005811 TaxID=3154565 RepID=UPI00340794F8